MTFPDTAEEFMEQYKIVDTEQVYTNGVEMVPIFRMRQWFEHEPERKRGKWTDFSMSIKGVPTEACGVCGEWSLGMGKNYCPNCGAWMKGEA